MNIKIKDMVMIGLAASLMAVFSQIAIPLPFSAVPVTLQVFCVVIISMILDKKCSTIALIIYTLIGAIGIPVYSNFNGGFGVLFGPLGGYIFGFIIMAFIVGFFKEKDNKVILFIGAYFGMVAEYVVGILQLKLVLRLTLQQALVSGLYPFIVKDLVMVAIGVIVGGVIRKRIAVVGCRL